MDGDVISYNLFAYCGNNPVMGSDPTGEWDWGTFLNGASLIATGAMAIAAAATVLTCGAAAPLMVAVATVTASAGVLTVANGAAEVTESVTGYNVIRDGAFGGDEAAYNTYRDSTKFIAEVGTSICGAYYSAKSGNVCFVAGTLVCTEDGEIPIEDIHTGDLVWAWDEDTGEVTLKPVVETYINQTDELVHVFVNGEEIVTTPTHPFYSPVKGWTDAVHLRAGDILVLVNGEYVVVEEVQHEILEAPITVYNFQVEDFHPGFWCLWNSCPYMDFTSCENGLCYVNERSEVEEGVFFGGEMMKAGDDARLLELWKKISLEKIERAYEAYMEQRKKEDLGYQAE